jgi:lipopolysaccharide/colanic/teichoic acid biosynthesis glycosyltransferase
MGFVFMTIVSRDLTGSLSTKATPVQAFQKTSVEVPAASAYRSWGKRALDLVLLMLAAPFWMTVVGVAALIIWVTERKSPFYNQQRVGLNGETFRLWKLRTMVVDADARLEAHLQADPAARAEWDATQKLKNDPRITAVGAFLRKTSLDELPQLFNVLTGDMSIVGPRPIMENQRDLYSGERYYDMRPGLTGLWQVSERNETEFADRVDFDNTYHNTLSLTSDLSVLARTVGVVVRGTGY